MEKRKLLLVVGAGASVDFGMPSVAEVNRIISDEAQRLFPLVDDPGTNIYSHIEGVIGRYMERHVQPHLRRDLNFEDILYTIFALSAAYPADMYTSPFGALVTANDLPEFSSFGSRSGFGEPWKMPSDKNIPIVANVLIDAVLAVFRERCRTIGQDRVAEFARLRSLMAELHARFDIAVVSLNYDNILYRVMPGIETGFDPATGQFEQGRILNRGKWPCILYLHGSVHFDMPISKSQDLHEIRWQPDIYATFSQNSFGRPSHFSKEGAHFPTSVIVAGYGKTTQILRRPFRTYYSELDRLVSACDAVLFAGYGFGDPHLNMAFDRFRDSRCRPVASIGLARDNELTTNGMEAHDYRHTVLRTFETPFHSMRWLGYSYPDAVEHLKRAEEFELSYDPTTPLSFWYNGLLAACDNPDKVIAQLS